MKKILDVSILVAVFLCLSLCSLWSISLADMIIDHTCVDLTQVPLSAIEKAKTDLHIAYGHTSHGSQITTGMVDLVPFINGGGLGLSFPENTFGSLDLDDYFVGGDLGNPDRTTWAERTRGYLDNNPDVNVVMWSWCGQASTATETEIDVYLAIMNHLETDYPDVTFVYMTGHSEGTGLTGNLHLRNQQIRNYCILTDKVLFDFYDIECYDPDGTYFGDKNVNDDCSYTGENSGGNWATEWQASHTEGTDWYSCGSAHSESLNANMKAYATWWMLAKIAGWEKVEVVSYSLDIIIDGEGSVQSTPQSSNHVAGTEVELFADPMEGYEFIGWTGDVVSTENPVTVVMDGAKNATATFTLIEIIPIVVHEGNEFTIGWDVVANYDRLAEIGVVSYNVYLSNGVTDPNHVNPVLIKNTITLRHLITLNTYGRYMVGVSSQLDVDGEELEVSEIAWSDELPNGEKFCLKNPEPIVPLLPALPTGLHIIY